MTQGRGGFTLVELLVALAIFLTVMSIVAFLFTTAVRVTKQGAQNQEAFEMARGAMRLLERDLSRAFTNRDHGDVYSFYGTPIGFTYVGMVPSEQGSDTYNLARVTYVIYHDQLNSVAGAVAAYESVSGAQVPTYALLRYVEPGVDNLDAFPIVWESGVVSDTGNATFEAMVQGSVNKVRSSLCQGSCEDALRQTARREIWLRTLAGGGSVVETDTDNDGINDGAVTIPSAWAVGGMFEGLDPSDYFVTENVRFLQVLDVPCGADSEALNTELSDVEPPNFSHGGTFFAQNGDICARVFADAGFIPNWPDFNENDPTAALPDPNSGAQPFFTYWDLGVISQGTPDTADDKLTPLAFTFWNDLRNMVGDGIDNDGDFRIDIEGTTLGDPGNDWNEIYGANVGSPLDARLPLAVTTDLTLFFRTPYVGAPDFNQRFTQRIDLPTGYRRTVKNTAAAP